MNLTMEDIDNLVADIRSNIIKLKLKPEQSNMITEDIKQNLNKLFPMATCQDVSLTRNTDKMFFGELVMPVFTHEDITKIVTTDDDWTKVDKYKVEIDSKMINGFIPITADEATAFLVHDVFATVHSPKPIIESRFYLDKSISGSSDSFKISDYSSYIELLGFGIKMTIHYVTSCLCSNKYTSNPFDDKLQISRFIKSGLTKLINNGAMWDKMPYDKGVVMDWVVRLYSNILKYRIPALHTLDKCIEVYPSKLIKTEMTNLKMRLNRIDDFSLIKEETSIPDQTIQNDLRRQSRDYQTLMENFHEICALPVSTYEDAYKTHHRIVCNMNLINYALDEDTELNKRTYYKLSDMLEYYTNLRDYLETTKMEKLREA